MGELAYMQHKSEQAHAYISAHPGLYAITCVRRAIYIWTGTGVLARTIWQWSRPIQPIFPLPPH